MTSPAKKSLAEAIRIIRDAFPDINLFKGEARLKECEYRRRIIEKEFAPALLGPVPAWAKESGYRLGRGVIFNSGAFCVYWGKDPDTQEIVALLQLRKEQNDNGHYKNGALSGYTEKSEQSFDGVLREAWKEEVCDHQGAPIIMPEMARNVLILEGKDFYKDPPVQYVGYACELSAAEIKAIKQHIEECKKPDYQAQVTHASKGETRGLQLLPLKEIIELSPDAFTYHRQHAVYSAVARRLGVGSDKSNPSSPIGYTIGDSPELFTSRFKIEGNRITAKSPPFP